MLDFYIACVAAFSLGFHLRVIMHYIHTSGQHVDSFVLSCFGSAPLFYNTATALLRVIGGTVFFRGFTDSTIFMLLLFFHVLINVIVLLSGENFKLHLILMCSIFPQQWQIILFLVFCAKLVSEFVSFCSVRMRSRFCFGRSYFFMSDLWLFKAYTAATMVFVY